MIIKQCGSYIVERQEEDGSFGSVFSTSLALQANAAAPRRVNIDKAAALRYLADQAGLDGGPDSATGRGERDGDQADFDRACRIAA